MSTEEGPVFTFSLTGGAARPLVPVSYASPMPNKFCSIKTARIFNKHITRNALCQAKAGQQTCSDSSFFESDSSPDPRGRNPDPNPVCNTKM